MEYLDVYLYDRRISANCLGLIRKSNMNRRGGKTCPMPGTSAKNGITGRRYHSFSATDHLLLPCGQWGCPCQELLSRLQEWKARTLAGIRPPFHSRLSQSRSETRHDNRYGIQFPMDYTREVCPCRTESRPDGKGCSSANQRSPGPNASGSEKINEKDVPRHPAAVYEKIQSGIEMRMKQLRED